MRTRPVVAIVGRPNVGKSTLFNRIVGERRAVVHDQPGMTRDRHYADAIYSMRPFTLIDTGGYEDTTQGTLLAQMRQQSVIAMEEADVVIFLTDLHEPNDPVDQEILERLRAGRKPFFLAVNKTEGKMAEAQAFADFSRFGLDEVYPISSLHGEGVFDLLDAVTADFGRWDPDEEDDEDEIIRIAIVGRQNVGKSTLLNCLFGQERVIANPMGGTTRDAIDQEIQVGGQRYVLIDTAGIRRRGKIERGPEKLSVHSSFRAIDRAHVVLLVHDASEGLRSQDAHVAGYVLERRRSCIVVLNKWDLVKDKEKAYSGLIKEVRQQYNFMPWAPILTISAQTGQRTHKIWELVNHCAENFRRTFSTSKLNSILKKATTHQPPPLRKGRQLKIKYVTQIGTMPPRLAFFVNEPKLLHFSYHRYLLNQFYMQLGLEGTPLVMQFKPKAPPRGWERRATAKPGEEELIHDELTGDTYYGRLYTSDGEVVAQEIDLNEIAELDDEEYGHYYDAEDEEGDDWEEEEE